MTQSPNDVQRYLDRPLDSLLEELALYREQASGGPARSPSDAWDKLVPALRKRVCDEWAWCQRRQDARFEEHIALATLLSQIVAPEASLAGARRADRRDPGQKGTGRLLWLPAGGQRFVACHAEGEHYGTTAPRTARRDSAGGWQIPGRDPAGQRSRDLPPRL